MRSMLSKTHLSLLVVLLCTPASIGITIISRQEWGARDPTSTSALANNLEYAIIHHTAMSYCQTKDACIEEMKKIQDLHMITNGWPDIGYNFLIGGDGNIYEGRGWNVHGSHATNWNSKSLGICLMGNFMNEQPSTVLLNQTKALLAEAVRRGQIKSDYILYGHRQVSNTACPGTNLWNEITSWPNWRA